MNEEMARRELIKVGERTHAPPVAKTTPWNHAEVRRSTTIEMQLCLLFSIPGETPRWWCSFNTGALHPAHHEVLINSAGPRQNGLTSWITALGLSSLPCSEAASRIHLVRSQHFIRPKLIGQRLTRTWLKGPIEIDGKSEHMHYGLLVWQSIYGSSKKLGWQFYQQTLCKSAPLKSGFQC